MNLISSLSFIGGGKVAKDIVKAFLFAGIIKANAIVASSRLEEDSSQLRSMDCTVTGDNKRVCATCEPATHASHASQRASHVSHSCEPCESYKITVTSTF